MDGQAAERACGQAPTWRQLLRRVGPRGLAKPAPVVRCEEAAAAPPPVEPAAPSDAAEAPAAKEPALQFEMFSREWQQMSGQDNFDGFRVEASTQVTKSLQASHTLFLGTQLRECGYIYQFGPLFQTVDGRTMMVARCGLDGGVNGRLIQKIGSGTEVKMSSQSHLKEPQRNMHDAAVEYTGKDWTFGGKLAYQGAWLFGGSFSQRILSQLHVGGDLTLVAVQGLMTIAQLGARYQNGQDIVTASVSQQPKPMSPESVREARIQYTRKVSDRLSLGTEYKYSHPDKESGLSMGYEYTFRNARVQGLLDTDGKVNCSVSDFHGVGFSGMIDYFRGDYKFGVLMHVMPPEAQAQ